MTDTPQAPQADQPRPIRTLLVANRGEIALRVLRTARDLGLRTVALHTPADARPGAAGGHHVRAADATLEVPSYLDVDAVVAAALACGADAVHPGYGFLSERPALARALADAGVRLVGPRADVMDAMGRKDHARAIAERAGVPVVPAWGPDEDPAAFSYPVLVKAAAGGGGKGMRVVRSPEQYAEALAAARREAASAFGDDTMLVERYVERGRHVEVQVLGDEHGTVVTLGERDCSPQRRHQKVLEEAPAPTLDPAARARLAAAARALAQQVGYTGAGTVEMLLDADTGEFFFLEMNTRLQVEHPVTEATTTVRGEHPDLVALQLRVAAGEPLGFSQDDVAVTGHAIEARVYAEDAFGGFLPQAGTATLVRWPQGPDVRVDHALSSGDTVSTGFDPMLGKVVATGADRESARLRLLAALDDTAVLGLTTNTGFLRALVATDAFAAAAIDTAWLDREPLPAPPDAGVARAVTAWVAAWLGHGGGAGAGSGSGSGSGAWAADGFRSSGPRAPVRVRLDRPVLVDLGVASGSATDAHGATVTGPDGEALVLRVLEAADHVVTVDVGDAAGVTRHRVVVNVQPGPQPGGPPRAEASHRGQRVVLEAPARAAGAAAASDGAVTAPMPGTVTAVLVSTGETVAEGDVLGVLEAMKMEVSLRAPRPGTVVTVTEEVGAQVSRGSLLFHVEQRDEQVDGDQGGDQGASARRAGVQ
ncbi:ATP-binding protein [Nocardioides bruguierae]|uniref:ATP-binding protein n=1 Tax=Nocardioides bruguierae TaxID=2945102 RepID=UPI0020228BF5|nr:biotin carboxylase N-terminal domain-containing protein [Nocardioides bruguierae]MCL8026787.1 ATP-grasp domain-containing protein [Nocardioides bruguierae]